MEKHIRELYSSSLPVNSIIVDNDDCVHVKSKLETVEDWQMWLNEFERKSKIKWILRRSIATPKSFLLSNDYVCQHSSFNERKNTKRGCDCSAVLTVRMKPSNKSTRYYDKYLKIGYNTTIKLRNDHSHTVGSADSLSLLRGLDDTRSEFEEYFNNGMNVAESTKFHEQKLELNTEEENVEATLADASINPKKRTVSWWYDEWRKFNLGSRNDESAFEIITKKIPLCNTQGTTVAISQNPFAICIVTPLMKRAHEIPNASEIVFVDSTASCDSQNHTITFMLTTYAAGAVPLCVLISQGQSESDYTSVFKLLKETMGEKLFCNKGSPKIFMTDDSDAEYNALQNVWPSSECRLCLFHVPQAVWRWLWCSEHKILKEDRKNLMDDFKNAMYAATIEDASRALAKEKHKQNRAAEFISKFY